MISSNSRIYLNDKYLENIKIIINWYVSLIRYEYKNDYISPENYENYLIFISDILPILEDFKDREEFLEIGYWLSKAIKNKVQNEFSDLNKTSMFTGLGFIAFSVYSFNKSAGILDKFKTSLNTILLDESYKKLYEINLNKTNYLDYDIIYGFSGIINYLIKFHWNNENKAKIIEMVKYLFKLIEKYDFNKKKIIKFCIKDNKTDIFPNGYIDFGIAHGMLGPLIVISKIRSSEYYIDLSDEYKKICNEYLNELLEIYNLFSIKEKNYFKWPSQLSIEDFINKNITKDNFQYASWCYGATSIANGLKQIYLNLKDFEMYYKYNDILLNILSIDFSEYNLKTPILCHGYASVLSMITTVYKDKNDERSLYNIECVLDNIFNSFSKHYRYGFEVKNNDFYQDITNDSLLEGSTGIVLSLLSIFNPKSNYKEILLI